MAEMGDNRNKAKAVHKCYSYPGAAGPQPRQASGCLGSCLQPLLFSGAGSHCCCGGRGTHAPLFAPCLSS